MAPKEILSVLQGAGKPLYMFEKSSVHSISLQLLQTRTNIIPLAETPLSIITSGRCYNLSAKFKFFQKIPLQLSSKKSLILLPNKCSQWNFHFSFSWDHLERFWFFNKYINTQMFLPTMKVCFTQLLTCQYFCWTFHWPFATHIQTHRWTSHPVTALTAD